MTASLPFDTTKFDELPINIILCKPVLNADGSARDHRIVFGNETFIEWRQAGNGERNFFGKLVSEILSGEKVLSTPLKNLPEPYTGFILTDVTDYEKKSARTNFLRTMRHTEDAVLLIRDTGDGRFEVVFVSKGFAKLMACSVDYALNFFRENGVIAFTHTDDRLAVKRMLRRRTSEESTKDLRIRQTTSRGETVWCNVTFTFVDDFGEHYVRCTFFDVTSLKIYEQRLKATYMSIGDNFYRANDRTLAMFRANITRNKVEDIQGRDLFGTDSVIRPYSELINLRAANYPIEEEREKFLISFNAEMIKARFRRGETQMSTYLFSRRKDGHYCYVNYRAVFTRHPITNEVIIFVAEQEAGKERVEGALLDKILARQFDMVAYLANDKYNVVVGDGSLVDKGSIFPKTREGFYDEYIKN
ncbi:MAG: PAS domain-containing protein, partial [Selenomonadaceae bacterium]|nr:PAS domain-containing protein [Selenomonadaceae bacterium]